MVKRSPDGPDSKSLDEEPQLGTKDPSRLGVRITNQFRKRRVMVYDLSCERVRLTLEMSAEDGEGDSGEWHIEAFAREVPERPTIKHSAATRREALQGLARDWAAKRGASGFPAVDWDRVTEALVAVRAV